MNTSPISDKERIFTAAAELPNPQQRKAFLDAACGPDDKLRQEVEILLAHDEDAGSFLNSPAVPPLATEMFRPITEGPGTVIGPYKLLQQIGEGGFGVVYMAEQQRPVRRKVALKIIKPGMDTREVIARFESERQALALMDHPNIARVLDAGATDSARPYFVMELVKGVPITEYCDKNSLPTEQRLALFITVCHAVQHAHQKGVIHRDLKPSNVMVTLHDGQPVPKVIDFGVSKATSQQLTEKTLFTAYGQMIGTPAYMSPEQAEMSGLDIDTRSDTYSLGVLLYELLTGTTPFDGKRLRDAGYAEMQRIIREEAPPRPSNRVSTMGIALTVVSSQRSTDPKKLGQQLRGDLDVIVMKAMEKERSRRYDTPNAFADDIQRLLNHEAIVARPASAAYRLRKFTQRNKAAVVTIATVASLLLAGTMFSTWSWIREREARQVALLARMKAETSLGEAVAAKGEAERERDRADKAKADESKQLQIAKVREAEARTARQEEAAQRTAAEQERDRANQESQISQAVRNFSEYDLLLQADPNAQAYRLLQLQGTDYESVGNPTIRELLDRAAVELEPAKINQRFGQNPLVQAEILLVVGSAYRGTGDFSKAVSLLERAAALYKVELGENSPRTLGAMINLGLAMKDLGQTQKAISVQEEVLKRNRELLQPDDPQLLRCIANLADAYQAADRILEAIPLGEEALRRKRTTLGADHPSTLISMNTLGYLYRLANRLPEGLPLCEEALKKRRAILGPQHPETLRAVSTLGEMYRAAGRFQEALVLHEEALEMRRSAFGPDHPETLKSMNNLGSVYRDMRQFEKALPLYVETLALRRTKLPEDHRDLLMSMNNLGVIYRHLGQFDKALPLLEQTVQLQIDKLGENHRDTLRTIENLVAAYRDAGQHDKVIRLYDETLNRRKAKLGPDDPNTLAAMSQLGSALRTQKNFVRAVPIFQELWEARKKTLPPGTRERIDAENHFGWTLMLAGQFVDAESHLISSYNDGLQANKFSQEWLRIYEGRLFCLYLETERSDDAAHWRSKWIEHSDQADAGLLILGWELMSYGRFAIAERILRECLAIREQNQPGGWNTLDVKSALGASLVGQKKYADAQPLLLATYEGLQQHEEQIPKSIRKSRLTNALQRLIELYTAWEKPVEATEWQKVLAQHQAKAIPATAVEPTDDD